MSENEISAPLADIRRGLIVSCQARPGQPLYGPEQMSRMAEAAVEGGAVGIRANGIEDIKAIVRAVRIPVIGLWKDGSEGVYITPTLDHALAVADAGASVIALDGTHRPRPDGRTLEETIAKIHRQTESLVLADVSTLDEGVAAVDAGADAVATTLSGYTPESPAQEHFDLTLVRELAGRVPIPVIAEGRIRTPDEARQALDAGAWAVVVGTAITAPTWITRQFVEKLRDVNSHRSA